MWTGITSIWLVIRCSGVDNLVSKSDHPEVQPHGEALLTAVFCSVQWGSCEKVYFWDTRFSDESTCSSGRQGMKLGNNPYSCSKKITFLLNGEEKKRVVCAPSFSIAVNL
jgi:hypothetical protein